ncbi:hypothetical protein [Marilutibacter chinensis]|uniref:HEPN AbiU2-like domain-containing protein n=1 Tax=Marilutibacter chinensis TaxID=2912247 RepID=A0ABS9HPW6_9GAMM|nr:hypothetical protein [Lysobacter chinensis]
MTKGELDQRVRQIDGFIRVLTQECHILDERRHILSPLIQDTEIQDGLKAMLDRTIGAGAWGHVAPLLAQDLVRDQARLFLDNGAKTGSLPNLWRKLNADPDIKNHYRRSYGRMFDKLHVGSFPNLSAKSSAALMKRFKDKDRRKNYALFDKSWAKLSADIPALKADHVAIKISTYRDKYVAHLEMRKLDEEPGAFNVNVLGLTFSDVLGFADKCQGIVSELGLLLTHTYWDPQQFAEGHAKQGTDMWRTLAGLSPSPK